LFVALRGQGLVDLAGEFLLPHSEVIVLDDHSVVDCEFTARHRIVELGLCDGFDCGFARLRV
jgi:hypothetical protein